MSDKLVDSTVVCLALGWSHNRLRVWRHRHPAALPVVARGAHYVALYRWTDVRHAVEQVLAQRSNAA